jgi:hypothetical protein
MSSPTPAPPPSLHVPEIELFCPGCGYSLRGIGSDVCPECGLHIDRSAAAASRIPWEHRRRIGRVRAYWRTLWMSSRAVGQDVMRPVNYRDARRFQLVTVLIAALPLVALAILPLPQNVYRGLSQPLVSWPVTLPAGWAIDLTLPLVAALGMRFALPLAIVLYFLAMTGVASYFFHPPHLSVVHQNRAIALSYYACTPLVFLLVPAVAAWVLLILETYPPAWLRNDFISRAMLLMVMGIAPIITLLVLWWGYVRMLRYATACSTSRAFALAVTLPIAWVVLAGLILVGLPWVVGYVMLVVWSFQG